MTFSALVFLLVNIGCALWSTQGALNSDAVYYNTVAIDRSGKLGYVSNSVGLFVTKDLGKSWNKLTSCAYASSLDVSNDGKTIMAIYNPPVGTGCGAISTSNDYGATWNKPSLPVSTTIIDGDVSGSGQYMVAVNFATGNGNDDVYISSDYGSIFTPVKGTDSINLYSGVVSQAGDRIFAGQSIGILLQSTDLGSSFHLQTTSPYQSTYSSMTCNEDCKYILATSTNSVSLSADFGVSWNATALQRGSAYNVALSSSGQVQYAGGFKMRLFKSTDYGQTWFVLDASTITNWSSIDCDATGQIVIASSTEKGPYFSTDAGATWTASTLV
jgi:photosystem II stability/assembly factor-like uncharacterized protein